MIELPENFDSVFRYIVVVSQRAEQLINGAKPRDLYSLALGRRIYGGDGWLGYARVFVPPVYETQCREVEVCPARWEWRRTTECEVPGGDVPAAMPGMAPAMPMDSGMPMPMDSGMPMPDDGAMPLPPADMMPPAGELPPADPFAR